MRRFALAATVMPMFAAGLAAQGVTMTTIGGDCRIIQIASRSAACAAPAMAVYTRLPNDTIAINVPLADERVLGFVGDRDAQPKPEQYVLYVKRVRIAKGAEQGTPVEVTGTCKMEISTDGSLVHRITCDATDQQGGKYLLDFFGNNQPVQVKQF
jgi:hypothetical protein